MFKITLTPQSHEAEQTQISVSGTALNYDGVGYDFSSLAPGDQVEGELPAIGAIKNINGVIHITLLYKYDSSLAEPIQSTDINDYIISLSSGTLPSPIVMRSNTNV